MRHFALLALFSLACKDKGGDAADGGGEGSDGVDGSDGGTDSGAGPAAVCRAPERPPAAGEVTVEEAFPALRFSEPVLLQQAPGDDSAWYAVEKDGRLQRFDNDPAAETMSEALDITDRVDITYNEMGLLGFTFHPDFATNGEAFVDYTSTDSGRHTVISRFTSPDGGLTFDPDSEEILLTIEQPYENHNGGMIEFGPDGYLYIGMGDGGSAGDPLEAGQDTHNLLAKMLRIDVDHSGADGEPYAIPADNPFADGVSGAPEVFAWGLRNPWRFSFDSATGTLWVGDVGQDRYEEVDIVELGGNYGWNMMEASHCYDGAACEGLGLIEPIVEYPHSDGVSISGGYVYRGAAIPSLEGTYLFGDYVTRHVWGVVYDEVTGLPEAELLIDDAGVRIASFSQGADGEVYIVGFNGVIQKIVPVGEPTTSAFPATLTATGCVEAADATEPAGNLVPYALNSPLWSDGAEKQRWFALPEGGQITIGEDGDWDLPVGSVVMKEFTRGGQRLETRLLVRHTDGEWAGYSYAWNAEGTDATYVPGGKTETVADGGQWTWPASSDCLTCHTDFAGRTLGLETDQLDRDVTLEDGSTVGQLAWLDGQGLFTASPSPSADPLPDPLAGADTEERRVRSYLHSNCSYCHRADSGLSAMDLRWTTADPALCGQAPSNGDLGVDGALLVDPGSPETSLLALRLADLGAYRMPPLATSVVHDEAVALVEGWIAGLSECPTP